MQDLLTVSTAHEGPGTVRIMVTGDLDLATTTGLHQWITAALCTATPPATVLVDLARVEFLDCTAVSTLLAGRSIAVSRGITCYALNTHGLPQRVLQLLGLDTVLNGSEQNQIDAEMAVSTAAMPDATAGGLVVSAHPITSDRATRNRVGTRRLAHREALLDERERVLDERQRHVEDRERVADQREIDAQLVDRPTG